MNPYPAGTRVFYWASNARIIYAEVASQSRMPNGTIVLELKADNGIVVWLPAAGVTKM